MNAKNESPYIHEEVSNQSWIKSKAGKLTALIAGGVLVLSASFGAGVAIGAEFSHQGPGIAGFDRDGDHKFPGGKQPDGQHPPRLGGHDDDHGQFNPNQAPTPAPSTQNG